MNALIAHASQPIVRRRGVSCREQAIEDASPMTIASIGCIIRLVCCPWVPAQRPPKWKNNSSLLILTRSTVMNRLSIFAACLLSSAVSLAMLNPSSNAAVVHTEIADTVLTDSGVSVDLNGDGTEDYLFFHSIQGGFGEFCDVLPRQLRSAGTHGAGGLMTYGLDPQQQIPGPVAWSTEGNLMIWASPGGTTQGDWSVVGAERFVALRIFSNGGFNYGWARVRNMGGVANMVLRDWAYETTPNTPIVTPPVGDVDINGLVNVDDLFAVIMQWGPCSPQAGCPADVNADHFVNVDDLFLVINHWS